ANAPDRERDVDGRARSHSPRQSVLSITANCVELAVGRCPPKITMGWFALHPVFAHGAPHPRLDKVIVRVWLPARRGHVEEGRPDGLKHVVTACTNASAKQRAPFFPGLRLLAARAWLPYVATALRDDVLTVALAHNRLSHIARHDNDRVNDTTRRMGNTVDLA